MLQGTFTSGDTILADVDEDKKVVFKEKVGTKG